MQQLEPARVRRLRRGSLKGRARETRRSPSSKGMNEQMNSMINMLSKSGLLTKDIDYYLIRVSMVMIFLFFGYQKWFEYEAQVLIPYISNGPLLSWMYPVFGIRASWFLGVSE